MNTLLTDTRHDEQLLRPPPLRRLDPLDRAALHLGIALIRWSRRASAPTGPRYRRTLSHTDRVRIGNDVERARSRSRAEHDLLLMRLR